jgi:hypothetical protein
MTTLAERQKAKLEELKKKPAGRAQVQDSMERVETPPQPDPDQKQRMGRPPRGEQAFQRTVSLTQRHLALLEDLAARSGRKALQAPRFSDVVRVAFNLLATHKFSDEEVRRAFAQELEG